MSTNTDEEESLYPIYALRFVTGDAFPASGTLDVQVVDPDPDSPDPDNPVMIPRNLTGWTGKAQIRQTTKKDAPLIATITLTGFGSDGKIHMYIPSSETNKVTRPCGWDLEITDPSGRPETILGGPVEPQGDYSR